MRKLYGESERVQYVFTEEEITRALTNMFLDGTSAGKFGGKGAHTPEARRGCSIFKAALKRELGDVDLDTLIDAVKA